MNRRQVDKGRESTGTFSQGNSVSILENGEVLKGLEEQ